MSDTVPARADIRQLRIQAKELLRSLQKGETIFEGKGPAEVKLAHAQHLLAQKYGFNSWPKLVEKLETPQLLEKLKYLIWSGDAESLEKLLKRKPIVCKHLNEPLFNFDMQPILVASQQAHGERLVPVLVKYGADPNIRSKWWAGGFSALELTQNRNTVKVLEDLGAKFDSCSAAAQGKIEVLQDILDKNPSEANRSGGDGKRPLHYAATAEIAEMLIDRGALLNQKDVDHESTPIQYQINNHAVLRVLLQRGATPDIFTAVAMDDLELLHEILAKNSDATASRVGKPPFIAKDSNGGHIYEYLVGSQKSPFRWAGERGSQKVFEELRKSATLPESLIVTAWLEDEVSFTELLNHGVFSASDFGVDGRAITDAAQAGKAETVRLLLKAGLDPMTPGMDSGSALHVASWFGHIEVVKLLLDRVPLDLKDKHHGGSPLGWATHGANYCRNSKGDYVAVTEALLQAGANPNTPANSEAASMLEQAGDREDVKEVLRRYGAK